VAALLALSPCAARAQTRLQSADLFKLRSVGSVQFSPDGSRLAYTIRSNDGPGPPASQLWLLELSTGKSSRVGDEKTRGSQPAWSPDGRSLAFVGSMDGKSGLIIASADGSNPSWMADIQGTNSSALTNTGREISWSPDGKSIAFVSAMPGPETS